jgi:transcriptional regulator with XRE-family HTH domain
MASGNKFDRAGKNRRIVDQYVGQRIRSRREQIGLSQGELARSLSLSAEDIEQIEKGDLRPEAALLADFASVLGLPVSDFFDGINISIEGADQTSNVLYLKRRDTLTD